MSVKIVQKSLPAGTVPYEDVTDAVVKQKVMLLNRNITSLAAQLAEVQRAAIELQNRPMPKQKEIEDIERYVAEAAASASAAAGSATSAGNSAVSAGNAATSASNSATAAGASETNAGQSAIAANTAKVAAESAKNDANEAKGDAEEARDEAINAKDAAESAASTAAANTVAAIREEAVHTATQKAQEASDSADRAERAVRGTLAGSVSFVNVDMGSTSYQRSPVQMSTIVGDASASYDVRVTFVNEQATSRSVVVNGTTLSLPGTKGASVSHDMVVSGSGSIDIDNISQYVEVFIKAWRK